MWLCGIFVIYILANVYISLYICIVNLLHMEMKVYATNSLKDICRFVNENHIGKDSIVSLMCIDYEYKLVYFG